VESFPKPGQPSGTKATTEPPCQLSTAASCALSAGLVVSNHLWKSWDGGWEHQLCQPKMDIYLLVVWACKTVVMTQIWINHETWGDLAKFVGLSPPPIPPKYEIHIIRKGTTWSDKPCWGQQCRKSHQLHVEFTNQWDVWVDICQTLTTKGSGSETISKSHWDGLLNFKPCVAVSDIFFGQTWLLFQWLNQGSALPTPQPLKSQQITGLARCPRSARLTPEFQQWIFQQEWCVNSLGTSRNYV